MNYIIEIILSYKSSIEHYLKYRTINGQYKECFFLYSDKYNIPLDSLIVKYSKYHSFFRFMPTIRKGISNFLFYGTMAGRILIKLPVRF